MRACGVVRAVLSASFAAVVQVAIFLLHTSNIARVQASLPPGAEDEIILIEHLPGRRVHLQDFFWTGAEDAPAWMDPNQGLTFYETRTVHQTVTVYSPAEGKDDIPGAYNPECPTCIEPTPRLDDDEDQNIGVLIGDDPGPRYWLLTVLRAGESVPPKVELRLARLYRAAFSRQQQRHLGLLSTDPRSRRAAEKRGLSSEKPTVSPSRGKPSESSGTFSTGSTAREEPKQEALIVHKPMRTVEISKLRRTLLPTSVKLEAMDHDQLSVDSINDYLHSKDPEATKDEILTSTSTDEKFTTILPELDQSNTHRPRYFPDEESLNASLAMYNLEEVDVESASASSSSAKAIQERSKLRSLDRGVREIVQIRMQNTSVIEGGATRLIYTVHLGGKPVPAETAARDMALLSPQEVALELGAPVLIQSEPYLKETRPLALSRKRDAWLLIGAAGAGFILLAFVLAGLIFAAKRKRSHSAAVAPPHRSILKKEGEYIQATSVLDTLGPLETVDGLDNTAFSTSETEDKTDRDGTSQRHTPGTLSRSLITPESPDSLNTGIHEVSSDNEEELKRKSRNSPWDVREHSSKKTRLAHGRIARRNAIDSPKTPDSADMTDIADHLESLESLENGYTRQEEATASPRSYLSMPSCKQFPNMRSVEPLSRVLEPVMVRHLDIDSPELVRRDNGHAVNYRVKSNDKFLSRTASATKDPGVVGPIVWSIRRQGLPVEGNGTSETDVEPTAYMAPAGPVGRARRRLNELLEDSFSLFGSRDQKHQVQTNATRPSSATRGTGSLAILSDTRGRSAHVSPVASPTTEMKSRPRTSVPQRGFEEEITETGDCGPAKPRGAWGSRPLSAGPFHRPSLPEVDTRRILVDTQLPPEDPAIPLIASIKKELEKFPALERT